MAGRQESKEHTVPAPGIVHTRNLGSSALGMEMALLFVTATYSAIVHVTLLYYVTLGDSSGCTHVTGVEYGGDTVTASRVQYLLQMRR